MEKPNLKLIKEISGNDSDFENNLIQILKKEFKEEVEAYRLNLELKKFDDVHESVHKLKHKISLLGLENGVAIASDFEEQVKKGNTNLKIEFEKVLDKILVYLYTK